MKPAAQVLNGLSAEGADAGVAAPIGRTAWGVGVDPESAAPARAMTKKARRSMTTMVWCAA